MIFDNISDKVEEAKFIDKNTILEYVSEEDIFQLVFKDEPIEHEYITSPLREDNRPGCWFEVDLTTDKLMFKDFGNGYGRPLDCFDVVKDYFELPNFYETLEFIYKHLIVGKKLDRVPKKDFSKPKKVRKKVEILINTRDFNNLDSDYWSPYEITKAQLIEDKVFPVSIYKMTNTKSGDHVFRASKPTYAYTKFNDGKKKIYSPYSKGKGKWLTNCTAEDIIWLDKLYLFGDKVVITKSYKDGRVLKNQGLSVIPFQNEGAFPKMETFIPRIRGFKKVYIWFDNDRAGIEASIKLKSILEVYLPTRVESINLPIRMLDEGVKDPSDLIAKFGRKVLKQFIKKK